MEKAKVEMGTVGSFRELFSMPELILSIEIGYSGGFMIAPARKN